MMYRVKDPVSGMYAVLAEGDATGFIWRAKADASSRGQALKVMGRMAIWADGPHGKYAKWSINDIRLVRVKAIKRRTGTGYRVRLKGGLYAEHYALPVGEADEKWRWVGPAPVITGKATALRLMAMMCDYHARCGDCNWDPSNLVLVRVK